MTAKAAAAGAEPRAPRWQPVGRRQIKQRDVWRLADSVVSAVAGLDGALLDWLEAVQELEVLELLRQLRVARLHLAQLELVVEARAVAAMSGDTVAWPGGVAQRRRGLRRRSWDHYGLLAAVADRVAVEAATDVATGVLDVGLARQVREALDRMARTFRPEWRLGELRGLRLDPDEYSEVVEARATVHIADATAAVVKA